MTEDCGLALRRVEQPGEHLERGRLAGAVRSQKTDHLARRDVERNTVNRDDLLGLSVKEGADGRAEARLPLRDVVGLAQIANADRGQNTGLLCHKTPLTWRLGANSTMMETDFERGVEQAPGCFTGVGDTGLEPVTSTMSTWRSNQLS